MFLNLSLFTIIRIAILFVALILCCVGTGVAQLKPKAGGPTKFYLDGIKGGGQSIKYKDFTCSAVASRMDAAFAFAIISCIVIGAALICCILPILLANFAKILKLASIGLSIAGVVTTLIAWAIVIGVYEGKFCGSPIKYKEVLNIDAGAALLIVTWILMLGDAAVAVLTFLGILADNKSAAVEANA